ncbi:peptide ABC transporter substrate-binding protein [Ligilactobacillus murinus]|uniref:peptide ABC transporter substrate-binding protein n=1 Tax=Ligilactobacillus murinus TaxID=1622 RepID=UPI0011DCF331|nr:peptide ABC transporter substrate-binding protein [Ligilactobacillus murinus]MCR1880423.1 peptide ABC transporter substrate-binding protein [Ligilactobacillus murinus]
MKLAKLAKAGAVVALSAVFLAACGKSSNDSASGKQVLNWSESAELPTMDLSKATDNVSFNQLNNAMEGLYRLGKNSKIEPGVAKKTTVSDDGMTYTFELRKDAKWSNGDNVTAKDFVYSWQRTVDPKTASQYAFLFDGIENAKAITDGEKPVTELGIKAEGDHKLVVKLEKAVPYFKLLMGFPAFFPQNQKVVEKYGDKYGTNSKAMVYNGPFKLEDWTGSNLKWTLAKNDKYWDKKKVKLDAINYTVNKQSQTAYNLYQSGKVDATALGAEQAKQLKGKTGYLERKEPTVFYLQFNQTKAEFQNKKIRQALAKSVDREQYVKQVLAGASVPAKGFVASGLAERDGKDFATVSEVKSAVDYNEKEAKKLFDEGLKELGRDKLEFQILSDDTDGGKKTTEFLQSAMTETFGTDKVKITVSNVPFKTRLARSDSGDFDVVMTAWGADFADPISFLELMTSDNAQNDGKWKNEEYDRLIDASKNADVNDPAKRWDDMVKAEKILMEDQGVAPIYQRSQPWMVKPSVKNIIYNGAGVNYNFKETYISGN